MSNNLKVTRPQNMKPIGIRIAMMRAELTQSQLARASTLPPESASTSNVSGRIRIFITVGRARLEGRFAMVRKRRRKNEHILFMYIEGIIISNLIEAPF